jgi:hypothetical protein
MEMEYSTDVLGECQIAATGCCGSQNTIQGHFNLTICYSLSGHIELGLD